MNDKQRKEFEKNVALLPKAFQDAIAESNWESKIVAIGERQKLYYDQIDKLLAEIALILTGLTSANDLDMNMVKEIGIENEKTDELVRAINHELFEPLEVSVQAKTGNKEPQFTSTTIPITAPQQAPAIQQFTTGVFKVAPEKYSVKSLDAKPQANVDPYHEPIE